MSYEYNEVVKVHNLLPPENWKRYKLFEVKGLREQILLEEASKLLAQKWRVKRPRLFGKKKHDQNTNRKSVTRSGFRS